MNFLAGWKHETNLEPEDANLDCDHLLNLSAWHQLDGFLYRHLQSIRSHRSEFGPLESELAKRAAENRVRFVGFVEPALGRVLEGLNEEGIPVIALKGAALNRLVFDDPSLRPVGDLDLLIEEDKLEHSRQVILDLGYRQRSSLEGTEPSPLDYHYCPRLLSPDRSVEIELHRHLVRADSPSYFDIDLLWQRHRTETLAGQPSGVLHPADLLMHLCLAFFQDRRRREKSFGSLRQLVDISAAYAHYADELEDSQSFEMLLDSPSIGPLYCSLWAAHHLVGCPISEDALDRIRPTNLRQQDLEAFIRRKVLDIENWAFNSLVTLPDRGGWKVSKALIRRIVPPPSFLKRQHCEVLPDGNWSLYQQHLSDLARTGLNLVRQPRAVWEDLTVDLWMNRLQDSEGKRKKSIKSP